MRGTRELRADIPESSGLGRDLAGLSQHRLAAVAPDIILDRWNNHFCSCRLNTDRASRSGRQSSISVGSSMKDTQNWVERLRREAEECRLISRLATNEAKRESFARLARMHDERADELEKLIASGELSGPE
jgi:hypothetical protein